MKLRPEVYPNDAYWDALQKMANRMGVSQHKYGAIETAYPTPGNAMKALQERLQLYLDTGNTEWLLDAANYAVIEFLLPSRSGAHFRATDSDESPGVPGLGDRAEYEQLTLFDPEPYTVRP